MRLCLLLSAVFLSALLASAAPAPSPPPAPIPPANAFRTLADENEAFAHLLLEAVRWVSDIYVRPVSRADLVQTALTALYESARRPVPSDLRRRIERAEKEVERDSSSTDVPAPMMPGLMGQRRVIRDERALLDLFRAAHADIGRAGKRSGVEPLRICCQAMLRSLDPYSGVIATNEERRTIDPNPERDGFGLDVVADEGEHAVLRDVLPGSPAQKAGLRPGDEIIRMHDSDGRPRQVKESLNVLNGRAPLLKPNLGVLALPEPIALTYRRRGMDGERRVTLPWRRFRPESVFGATRQEDNSWNYWLDAERKIAHLRLGNLVEATPDELSDILTDLRNDGLRGLILDLRWCPGGALLGSVKTAELFLGEGTIATVRYRNQPEDVFRSTNEDKHNDFSMVVLMNGDSTGGAEMIAAALQDHHRAVVIGQRTRGKGNVQKLRGVGTVGLKVTSGTILRPNGKELHRFPDSKPTDAWGVQPDAGHEFRVSAEVSRALRTWWAQQTMRPGSSTERLPLDDPLADPQRNAAAEALTKLLNRKDRAKAE